MGNNKMQTKQISEQSFNQCQSWNYHWTGKLGKKSVKVEIRRNAYDMQSYINGFVMKDDSWSKLIYRPITLSPVKEVSYVDKNPDIKLFQNERDSVLEEISQLIEI